MRILRYRVTNALRNGRRLLRTVLGLAVSLFMLCTPMTVLTELERETAGEMAR